MKNSDAASFDANALQKASFPMGPTTGPAKVKSSARPNTRQKTKMIRTSRRLRGEQAPETEEDQFKFEQLSYEYDETERDSRMILSSDVRGKDTKEEKAKIKKLMERRCDNRGRGSVYDSKVRTNGRERERERVVPGFEFRRPRE